MASMEEPPVNAADPADLVSAFMSLPEVLQSAALMVIFAARDLPKDDTIALPAVLKKVAELDMLSEPASHYLGMCGNVCNTIQIARFNGWSPSS
jgi:hypothetical protein